MGGAGVIGLVPAERVTCAPWSLRGMSSCARDGQHPIGAECVDCGRSVAQPRSRPSAAPVCLYCALDCGMLPAVEIPPVFEPDGMVDL